MEEMDDLYTKIQVFLMKKDEECGKLRFLTSKTTVENSSHVDNVCDTIATILETFKIPFGDEASRTNEKCVQTFKYLVLNTYFECQEHLTEDLVNGHLVDMCPPLSPYLLIEILWSLKFENILSESILHVPLDLCLEILTISRRCLNLLDFDRGLEFVAEMTLNCYKKMIHIGQTGTQSTSFDENLELLTINWQEFIALFLNDKFLRLHEVQKIRKSERRALILKKVLTLTKNCLKSGKENLELLTELNTMYKITFGRLELRKSQDDLAVHLRMLDQECADLLLKKIKEINCSTYLDWASLDDNGNSAVSVQQSIGNSCYDFIEFVKGSEHFIQNDNLIEGLQHLSSKPKPEANLSQLSFDQLCREVISGKKESFKALMSRYKEWNHEAFGIVEKNRNLIDKDDFLNLLEYLTFVVTKSGQEEHKTRVYTTVTRVLSLQRIPCLYQTILEFILKHDASNILESSGTEESFKHFMAHNKNFKSPQNLRIVLFFMVKNPRKILKILVKIAIGDPEFSHIMVSPSDLLLLSPIMRIRNNREETMIVSVLREVCLQSVEWNAKKFTHVVHSMVEDCVISPDKMVEQVFVPFLNNNVELSNLKSVLNCLRRIEVSCTRDLRVFELLEVLALRISRLRNEIKVPKYSADEALSLLIRVVDIYLKKSVNWLDRDEMKLKIGIIRRPLQPIDRHRFSRLSATVNLCPILDVYNSITDYELICFVVMNKIEAQLDLRTFTHFREDFLRHIFLKATENEFARLAVEATIIRWNSFGWRDEYEGYDKIVDITVQSCVYCLVFPELNSPDAFACLVKGLAKFSKGIASLKEVRNIEKIYESLVKNLRSLDNCVKYSIFKTIYTPIILMINNRASNEPVNESLSELLRLIEKLGNDCLEMSSHDRVYSDRTNLAEATNYRIAYEFVNACIVEGEDKNCQSLRDMYGILCER